LGAEDRLDIEPAGGPIMVWGSVAPLELAVSNLVRNAIEASPPGDRVRLTISADEDTAEVQVEDHGPGLDGSVSEKVFEPFFSTKTDRGGTGLGLAITRDMIAQLGGSVDLDNRDGGGARATIRLQRWQDQDQSS
jgi:two-component system sensor histidine kinase FlrB